MKRILVGLSEHGYWGEELIGPLAAFDAAGYEVRFFTSKGKRAHALPPSVDATYVDPPLGKPVTSEDTARKVRDLEASDRLNNPINLSQWFPDRPYRSEPEYLRKMEAYNDRADQLQEDLQAYAAL